MKQVPILRITEMLATGYAIHAHRIAACTSAPQMAGRCYGVQDDLGRSWRLYAEDEVLAQDVVIGTDVGLVRQPTVSGEYQLRKGGIFWTLFAVKRGVPAPGVQVTAQQQRLSARALITAEDSRALERVGSWLAQPAGLPTAGDPLGQRFLEQWQDARPIIGAWHQRAEALHDGLQQWQGAGTESGVARPWLAEALADWDAYCWQLHELLELQQRLLGQAAPQIPSHLRQRGLERFAQLLTTAMASSALRTPIQAQAS